jgi:hypothetical protein
MRFVGKRRAGAPLDQARLRALRFAHGNIAQAITAALSLSDG